MCNYYLLHIQQDCYNLKIISLIDRFHQGSTDTVLLPSCCCSLQEETLGKPAKFSSVKPISSLLLFFSQASSKPQLGPSTNRIGLWHGHRISCCWGGAVTTIFPREQRSICRRAAPWLCLTDVVLTFQKSSGITQRT